MKITVEISDALLLAAKKMAARERTSVSALIEQGLSDVVSASRPRREFRLRKASFRGHDLSAGAKCLEWREISELATYLDGTPSQGSSGMSQK